MGCSHTHVKPTAKVKRDGLVSHQGSGVTNDQSHTTVIAWEGGYYPPPKIGCSHTHIKPTAKVEWDGLASPSIEEKAIAICWASYGCFSNFWIPIPSLYIITASVPIPRNSLISFNIILSCIVFQGKKVVLIQELKQTHVRQPKLMIASDSWIHTTCSRPHSMSHPAYLPTTSELTWLPWVKFPDIPTW